MHSLGKILYVQGHYKAKGLALVALPGIQNLRYVAHLRLSERATHVFLASPDLATSGAEPEDPKGANVNNHPFPSARFQLRSSGPSLR